MLPGLSFLILPYTRAELPGWGKLMKLAGVWSPRLKNSWSKLPPVVLRGKKHKYLMTLDLSDWAQRRTFFTGRYYELEVLSVLDILLRRGDSFVDIGANYGMITLHARSLVGESGTIDSFEPNLECVAAIKNQLAMNGINNCTVHPCALAETPGTLNLSLTSEHSGTATLTNVGHEAIRILKVDVRVGDACITTAPRLIKIDVEGYELHVLKGLKQTLLAHKPFLITELVDNHLERAGNSSLAVRTFLIDLGYIGYGLGLARKFLRHTLSLHPLAGSSTSHQFTDVLWVHQDQKIDLGKYISASAD